MSHVALFDPPAADALLAKSDANLRTNAELRYGNLDVVGPAIRQRLAHNYFAPNEHYESLVSQLVTENTSWLDIGCGRHLFPGNPRLATQLADRCKLLVGLDPDETINDNEFVHQKVQTSIEVYRPEVPFDLVTLRMVAEHIPDPINTVRTISELCAPGGLVVIFTVSKWSITSLAARFTPMRLHHWLKKRLWGTEERDTFPVRYRMNTRRTLDRLFRPHGFEQTLFRKLPDVVFWRFSWLGRMELMLLNVLQSLRVPHVDTCILAAYTRTERE